MLLKTLSAVAAAAICFQSAEAAPASNDDLVISVSAADIVKNDLAGYEGHPVLGVFTRWLHASPESLMLRDNATHVVERFPTFHSVECSANTEKCLLVSRMSLSDEMAEMRERDTTEHGILPRAWSVERLVTEIHYKTYHTLTNDEGDDEYAGFEHYITFDWNCRTVLFKSTGSSELMSNHGFQVYQNPRTYSAWVDTTVMHNGPLHNEHLVVTFSCGLFNGPCCMSGGYETLRVEGETSSQWAAPVERTCNYGKQSSDTCS